MGVCDFLSSFFSRRTCLGERGGHRLGPPPIVDAIVPATCSGSHLFLVRRRRTADDAWPR